MIEYVKGDLLKADSEALVNAVNTMGVMGKGIALQFKKQFPLNFKLYSDAYKKGKLGIGKMLVVKETTLNGEKYIINFPTKIEWSKKSQYSYIEEGLKDLIRVINEHKITCIALPSLGCGNGGLNWDKVKTIIETYLGNLPIRITVFEPTE
jgi:O-acetyl-ADP-ribose deacetylase (regulator of RNase III)